MTGLGLAPDLATGRILLSGRGPATPINLSHRLLHRLDPPQADGSRQTTMALDYILARDRAGNLGNRLESGTIATLPNGRECVTLRPALDSETLKPLMNPAVLGKRS